VATVSVNSLVKHLSKDRSPEQDNVVRSIFMDKHNASKLAWFLAHGKIAPVTKYTYEDIIYLISPECVKDNPVSRKLSETTCKDFYVEDYDYSVRYVQKAKSCKERNIPFLLTFSEYKNILKTKKCKYTGVEMNDVINDPFLLTLERIDANLPYVKGNVVAVCNFINSFKSVMLENSNAFWKDDPDKMLKDITRMVSVITKKNIKSVEIKQKRGVK
jgi:hypothetical protein